MHEITSRPEISLEKRTQTHLGTRQPAITESIDWYSVGQARTVIVDGVEVTIRLVGRKGRRARICLMAPAGAMFSQEESGERIRSNGSSHKESGRTALG